MNLISRAVYALISLTHGIISLMMIVTAVWGIWVSIHEEKLLVSALLPAIGLIVIGMAVFDVCKFLLEEEVFYDGVADINSGTHSHLKERKTLLKFLIIITIAVFLEALVFIFDAEKKI